MSGNVAVGGGAVEYIGAGFRQNLQFPVTVSGAVYQRKPGSQDLRGGVVQELYITAIGMGVQRYIIFPGQTVHLPVVPDVHLPALIRRSPIRPGATIQICRGCRPL